MTGKPDFVPEVSCGTLPTYDMIGTTRYRYLLFAGSDYYPLGGAGGVVTQADVKPPIKITVDY